jgi:hypothetical protein
MAFFEFLAAAAPARVVSADFRCVTLHLANGIVAARPPWFRRLGDRGR